MSEINDNLGAEEESSALSAVNEVEASSGNSINDSVSSTDKSTRRFLVSKKTRKNSDSKKPWWRELISTVVVVILVTAVFKMFIGQIYEIPSGSMEPTMQGGEGISNDRVYVDKLKYRFSDPKVGDVIVFKAPTSWGDPYKLDRRSKNNLVHHLQDFLSILGLAAPDEYDLTKRVIATGGQTISCRVAEGGLKVDGKLFKEKYLDNSLDDEARKYSDTCFGVEFGPIKIPADRYWVMGDNRGNSADSRYHMLDEAQGTIPRGNIIGKVQYIIYPFNRLQKIH